MEADRQPRVDLDCIFNPGGLLFPTSKIRRHTSPTSGAVFLERNPITLHHSLRLRNSCGIRLG